MYSVGSCRSQVCCWARSPGEPEPAGDRRIAGSVSDRTLQAARFWGSVKAVRRLVPWPWDLPRPSRCSYGLQDPVSGRQLRRRVVLSALLWHAFLSRSVRGCRRKYLQQMRYPVTGMQQQGQPIGTAVIHGVCDRDTGFPDKIARAVWSMNPE